jgi:DNA-binding NarL/FixJ family response regulator
MIADTGKVRVYVIDDDENVVASITRSLTRLNRNLAVTGNCNPITAISEIVENRMDVVIVDFNMPHLNGFELANIVKLCLPHTVFILLSGELSVSVVAEFKNRMKDIKVFQKPFCMSALNNALSTLLRPQQRMISGVSGHSSAHDERAAAYTIDSHRKLIEPNGGSLDWINSDTIYFSKEGKLNLCTPEESKKLEKQLRSISNRRDVAVTAFPLKNKEQIISGALVIFMLPISIDEEPHFKVFYRSFHRQIDFDKFTISEMFGLGIREAQLASLLLQNHSINDAATEMGITNNSARTYAKRIYKKIGVNGMSELLVTLLQAPIGYTKENSDCRLGVE